MYEAAGFIVPNGTPGASVTNEFPIDINDKPLAALYVFIDEYIALFRYAGFYFTSAIPNSPAAATTFYRLSARQARNLASIRLLCSTGLDTNARMLVRLLYETSLLWSRFLLDEDARIEFEKCFDSKSANEYWHKYLSKGKTESFMIKATEEKGLLWLGNYKEAIEELKAKNSLTAHPTNLLSWFDGVEDLRTENYAINPPTAASHFTLSHALFAAAMPFAIKPDLPYKLSSIDLRRDQEPWPPIHSKPLSWEEYNKELRDMFPRLWVMAVRFIEELRSVDRKDDQAQQ
jgi:hypothetical protein